MSPFCAKLETYLRMAKIDYQVRGANIQEAPKGRVPYVKIDGKPMADSELIIEFLKEKHGDPLDAQLTPLQRAQSLAVRSLLEDRIYFATAYLRWSDPQSSKHVREVFLGFLPPVIGPLIFGRIQKGFLKLVKAQGIAEHDRATIVRIANEGLTAVSTLLGDRPFFHGDEPTSIDATLFGFLIQALWVPWDSELKQHAQSLKNLEPYCLRMKQRYWA